MLPRVGASIIVFCGISFGWTLRGHAEDTQRLHPGPWPIWHWHNHQPRQSQLDAMHKRNVTPKEAREIDRLYNSLSSQAQKSPQTITRPDESSTGLCSSLGVRSGGRFDVSPTKRGRFD